MNNQVNCPKCGFSFEFDMEKNVEEKVKHELNQKYLEHKRQLEKQSSEKLAELEAEKKKFDDLKQNELQLIQKRLEEEKLKQRKEIEEKLLADNDVKIKMLEEDNQKKDSLLKQAQMMELEVRKKANELAEKQQSFELEVQRKIDEERKLIEENARKREAEQQFMKLNEKEQLIQSLQKNLEELNRKVEQGSMQIQGEVQEIALEKLLQTSFPFDVIEEVGKGVKGADCIQTVRNNVAKECGKIIYESKRTKDFKQEWLEKLKADMRNAKADVAVIVTESMPKDMDEFGVKDDVWICTFKEVRALATVLRDGILKIDMAKSAQENKGDKMNLLYNFLTGNEFAQQVAAIVQGFTQMKSALEKEKIAMQKIWKEREKQIDLVVENTVNMYGSIKGIAGTSVKTIPALELGDSTITAEE